MAGFFYLSLVSWTSQASNKAADLHAAASAAPALPLPFYGIFFPAMIMLIAFVILAFHSYALKKPHGWKFPKATLANFLFSQMPFILPVIFCVFAYGPFMFKIWLAFGLLGALGEYLLGKALQYFVSKKFWFYNYWSIDSGHFTPLAIPGFAFLGFYFWALALIFELLY